LPVRISDAAGLEALDFTLRYDPGLLEVSAVGLAAGLPVGAEVTYRVEVPGELRVSFISVVPLSGGARDLVVLTAAVPEAAKAQYRGKALLALEGVSVNDGALPVLADAAVQVVAYLGDSTGNGSYGSLDGQRIARWCWGWTGGLRPIRWSTRCWWGTRRRTAAWGCWTRRGWCRRWWGLTGLRSRRVRPSAFRPRVVRTRG
jgi:hypothetical protein